MGPFWAGGFINNLEQNMVYFILNIVNAQLLAHQMCPRL